MPPNNNIDKHHADVIKHWCEFARTLKLAEPANEIGSTAEYIAKTKSDLFAHLCTQTPNRKTLIAPQVAKAMKHVANDKHHVYGCTDKNLGIYKMKTEQFITLSQAELDNDNCWQVVNQPFEEIMANLHTKVMSHLKRTKWRRKSHVQLITAWKNFAKKYDEIAVFHGSLKVHKTTVCPETGRTVKN